MAKQLRYVDCMTETRHYAAVQQERQRPGQWRLVNLAARRPQPAISGPMYAAPAYWLYEMSHAALNPSRAFADATRLFFKNPVNPLSHTTFGKTMAGEPRIVRALDPPLRQAGLGHQFDRWSAASACRCTSRPVWERPFCRLLHFERAFEHPPRRPQPQLLIVAPMSGHYATLLRGTVEGFLPNHDVYITEWVDARMVPLSEGRFDLDDYIDYVISMLHLLGGDCMSSRCASRRCRCSRRSRAWKPTTIPTCRTP